jgi:hypothetical protein
MYGVLTPRSLSHCRIAPTPYTYSQSYSNSSPGPVFGGQVTVFFVKYYVSGLTAGVVKR